MAFLALCIASNFLLSQADNWGGVESTAAQATRFSFSSAVLHLKHAWLFGGVMQDENHQSYHPQLRCFDIEKEQWKEVAPKNSPKGRYGHSAIVTPSGKMWIYGGGIMDVETQQDKLATELVYIGLKEGATSESWSQVQPEKKPKDRVFHTAVYYEGFMWIFGGAMKGLASGPDNTFVNDVHAFDIEAHSWSEISCEGQKPAPRQAHSAVIGADGRMWVYGGNAMSGGPPTDSAFFKDLHVLDLNKKSWSKVETAGFLPGLLFHHASVMDAAGRLWLVGGVAFGQQQYSGNAYFLDTTLADDSWHGVPEFNDTANPDAPPLDKMASRAIIESSGKIWVFGGMRSQGHASKKDWTIYWLDSNAPKPTSSTTPTSPTSSTTSTSPTSSTTSTSPSSGDGSKATGGGNAGVVIIVILLLLALGGGGVFFFVHRRRNLRLLQEVHEPRQIEIGELRRA
ncbi:unnamed protein product [Cladocopium goreaui]|uniref:Leucine-zipper-like transcriptional regulator 1 n=1 Tax=Cladocopium goreaui TaxID=2562237 RepID=A0A9P1FHV7_9DINO|nr:unnamed protein product [Cladocopium goreaui]